MPKEELAVFLMERGHRWLDFANFRDAVNSFAWAYSQQPANVMILNQLMRQMNQWGKGLQALEPPGCHPPEFRWPLRRCPPTLPWNIERDILTLEATEQVLKDPSKASVWWEPMRNGVPTYPRPRLAMVEYTPAGKCQVDFRLTFEAFDIRR